MTRSIDIALEALHIISENQNQIPISWLNKVNGYAPSDYSLLKSDLAVIVYILQSLAPCKLLEIGAGSSTSILFGNNANGLNISLEDSIEWVEKVRPTIPSGTGIILSYDNQPIENQNRQRTDWRAVMKKLLGNSEDKLRVPYYLLQKRALVPDWLWSIEFDVIVVDGPFGFGAGRSGTILLASKLASPKSVIFVDDAVNRPHEMEKVMKFFPERYAHAFTDSRLMMLI